MIRGLKHVIQEEKLKDFGLSNLKNIRSRADLVAAFNYPTGEYGEGWRQTPLEDAHKKDKKQRTKVAAREISIRY